MWTILRRRSPTSPLPIASNPQHLTSRQPVRCEHGLIFLLKSLAVRKIVRIFAAEFIHKVKIYPSMTENYDIDYDAMSDERLLSLVGNFIKHHRIEKNIDQTDLAKDAGISRSTLSLMDFCPAHTSSTRSLMCSNVAV